MEEKIVCGNWNENGKYDWVQVSPAAKRFGIPGSECTVVINKITRCEALKRDRPMHTHPHEQVMLILEGNGRVLVGDEAYPMKSGSYAVIPPNVPHRFDASDTETDILNIDIFTPARNDYVKLSEEK